MNVSKMTTKAVREMLQDLVNQLDKWDEEDFFGTKGWRHFLGYED